MQKYTLLICSLCALVVLGIGLSSCKDEEPFVKPNLTVSNETLTVAEGAGTVQVEFVLDRGAPGDYHHRIFIKWYSNFSSRLHYCGQRR